MGFYWLLIFRWHHDAWSTYWCFSLFSWRPCGTEECSSFCFSSSLTFQYWCCLCSYFQCLYHFKTRKFYWVRIEIQCWLEILNFIVYILRTLGWERVSLWLLLYSTFDWFSEFMISFPSSLAISLSTISGVFQMD